MVELASEINYNLYFIDAYVPPDNEQGWKNCKVCGIKPRIWVFDNGRFAKCLCSGKYGSPQAKAESILSVHNRSNNNFNYNLDGLRQAWNKYVDTGIRQAKLKIGRW